MRPALIVTLALLASAGAAQACDMEDYWYAPAQYDGVIDLTPAQRMAAQEAADAARLQAIESARSTFLARFDIKTDEPQGKIIKAAVVSSDQDTNADRRSRPDASYR